MSFHSHFLAFVLVSFVAFLGVLRISLRRRSNRPKWSHVLIVAAIVVAGGMLFARWGATSGLPWWVYYTVPALVTLLLPPLAFRMEWNETVEYLVLASLMPPAIHVVFSLLLGWKEYMPFLPIPSLTELLSGCQLV